MILHSQFVECLLVALGLTCTRVEKGEQHNLRSKQAPKKQAIKTAQTVFTSFFWGNQIALVAIQKTICTSYEHIARKLQNEVDMHPNVIAHTRTH